MLKIPTTEWSEEGIRLERRYLEDNPHAGQLRRCFELAHIDYGRIDYGLVGDSIQVWEINTNPTIGPGPGAWRREQSAGSEAIRRLRKPNNEWAHARIREALRAIDLEGDSGPAIDLHISRPLRRGIRTELAAEHIGAIGRRLRRKIGRLRGALRRERAPL
jgi:hypothetical protein